jgi:hypothetical protein
MDGYESFIFSNLFCYEYIIREGIMANLAYIVVGLRPPWEANEMGSL